MALYVILVLTSADSSTYAIEILPLFELEVAASVVCQRRHLSGRRSHFQLGIRRASKLIADIIDVIEA